MKHLTQTFFRLTGVGKSKFSSVFFLHLIIIYIFAHNYNSFDLLT